MTEAEQVTPPEPEETAPAARATPRRLKARPKPKIVLPYRVSRWHGKSNFECKHCQFATLVRERMLAHLDECPGAGR